MNLAHFNRAMHLELVRYAQRLTAWRMAQARPTPRPAPRAPRAGGERGAARRHGAFLRAKAAR